MSDRVRKACKCGAPGLLNAISVSGRKAVVFTACDAHRLERVRQEWSRVSLQAS